MRSFLGFAVVSVLGFVAGCSSPPASPDLPAALQRRLDAHLAFLASDALQGRETGESGGDVTAQYVASAFAALGLEPGGDEGSYLQAYPLLKTRMSREGLRASVLGAERQELTPGEHFVPRGAGAQGYAAAGGVAFVGWGLPVEPGAVDPYAGLDVAGRFVVALDGSPTPAEGQGRRESSWRAKQERAEGAGAAGLVLVAPPGEPGESSRRTFDWLGRNLDRQSMVLGTADQDPAEFPRVYLNADGASLLFAAGGRDFAAEAAVFLAQPASPGFVLYGVSLDLEVSVEAEALVAHNAAGLLRGAHSERGSEVLVVTAHMDHVGVDDSGDVFNGADDNASGTSALLMAAELLAARPEPLDRSVLFLAVSGEEKGLLGSEWWVDHPTVPIESVVGNVNTDMVGRNAPDALGVTPSPQHAAYNTIVERAVSLGPRFGLDVAFESGEGDFLRPVDVYYGRSDHANFSAAGIPVAFFFSGEHEDYHRVTDTYDKLDRTKIGRVAALVAALLAELAQDPQRPQLKAAE